MTTTTRKYHGIRKACSETSFASPYGMYVQIAYNPDEDRILTALHTSINSWTVWDDGIIHVCNACHPMTMAEIREAIDRALSA